jgi:hypothetical protein
METHSRRYNGMGLYHKGGKRRARAVNPDSINAISLTILLPACPNISKVILTLFCLTMNM